MTQTASHYEILGIGQDANNREIKNAFFTLIQQHPPEQKPKEYQRLREAYDVLSDPVARKEYDSMSLFGDEIEALREQAEEILNSDEPDYEEAVRLLKKAIVLGPDIGILRNLLGRCHLQREQPKAALNQFERAVSINPNNEAYLLNQGKALEDLERVDEAEAVYRNVWARDEEDYAAPRALAQLLYRNDRSEEAYSVLDQAIEADGQVDFQDFFCLYDKIHFYLFDGKHDDLRDQLDVVVRVSESQADRKFAAFMLTQTAADLFDLKAYTLANDFMEVATNLDSDNEFVQGLAGASGEAATISKSVSTVVEDDSFHPIAQELVRLSGGLYLGFIEKEDVDEHLIDVLKVLDTVMDTDPDAREIKASFRRIKSGHSEVFGISSELYESILQSPPATKFRAPCPHCGEKVSASKGRHSPGGCPFCNKPLILKGDHFEKPSASTDSGLPGWVWVAGFILFLWLVAQC